MPPGCGKKYVMDIIKTYVGKKFFLQAGFGCEMSSEWDDGASWSCPRQACGILLIVVTDFNAQLPSGDADP
jgi:hypothetical protein